MKNQIRQLFRSPVKEISKRLVLSVTLAFFALLIPNAHALTLSLNPSDDGYVAPFGSVNGGRLVVGANGWQGVLKYSTASIPSAFSQAQLSISTFSIPVGARLIEVYAYESQTGLLNASDFNAGTHIGSWSLPDLGFFQDAYFDVTSFLTTVHTPYVAFNLRSAGNGDFCSLEHNYGHASQLIITTVPEPSALALIGAGMVCAFFKRRNDGR